jgi:mono/diheme cytochrome c family protein
MSRLILNSLLLLGTVSCLGLAWLAGRNPAEPNSVLLLENQMARSPAYDSFAPNPNFPDGMTLQTPPAGTIARGQPVMHYESSLSDAKRAGEELKNPLPPGSAEVRERGKFIFTTYCQVCHGPTGLGDGPVTRRGVPPPLSMLTGKAVQMKDGEMFHLLTYGQGNMASHAVQLSPLDRWCVIDFVREMQKQLAVAPKIRLDETVKLFQNNCAACHGLDGTGSLIRTKLPTIPDFTSRAWQVSQTDLEIINRIDFGDLPHMPTFRYLLTRHQILALAAYIRTFAGTPQRPALEPPAGPVANLSPVQIFRNYCLACHNVDGKGGIVRAAMPDIPDFTADQWWRTAKPDQELSKAILSGGKFMPPMKDKLSPADADKMVQFMRAFKGGKQVVSLESTEVPTKPVPFPPGVAVVKTPQPGPTLPVGPALAKKPGETTAPPAATPPPMTSDVGARVREGAVIFRQYCIVCHGPDGTGSIMRANLPPIPDFTNAAWQTEHSDPQLLISVLDGKGTLMPANRGRVTESQARDLVAYVRAFGPSFVKAAPAQATDFDERFKTLLQQWETLEDQLKALSPPSKPPPESRQ